MNLYLYRVSGPEGDPPGLLDSMANDSLRGLTAVLEAAMKLADKAVPTVLRVVDFCMRWGGHEPWVGRPLGHEVGRAYAWSGQALG